ncbi:amino acid permease [Legionella israelensis]|uniref:amino acid permease n=1 Tax=Legionella israelensis TaxID=454 RepID=UPI001FD4E12D|nr:amino acid permease [Legionella israelensis]
MHVTNPIRPKQIRDGGFNRSLKDRHIQLIALGGIIGSGYFLGTGEMIHLVGPAVFLAYILGGMIIYLTMLCLGELAVAIPVSGSFVAYSSDFIAPEVACGVGWSYWLSWVAYIPAECVAGGIIMEMFTGINGYIWAVVFGMLITYFNLAKVEAFGEIEFWLALIKIIALLGFVILSILIFFGLIHGNQPHQPIGLNFLFHKGGLLPNGSMALLTGMVLLLVNYQGSEIIGLAAGESRNPERVIPNAIRNVTLRIIFIYVIPVFFLVLIFPWQKANLNNSVFADALNFYGLKWAGTITSFVTLTATLSCANSGLYGTVRSLNALAREGMAPESLAKFNHLGIPKNAVFFTLAAVWILLAFGYFFGQSKLYIALLLLSGFTGMLCWISLCWAQINFRKRLKIQGYSVADLKFAAPGSPYTAMLAIGLMLASLILLLFNNDSIFIVSFAIGLISFIVPFLVYKFFNLAQRRQHIIERQQRIKFEDLFPDRTSSLYSTKPIDLNRTQEECTSLDRV